MPHLNEVSESTLVGWLAVGVRRRDVKHADRIRVAMLRRMLDRATSGGTVVYSSTSGIVYEMPDGRLAVHLADRLRPVETQSLTMAMAMLTSNAVRRAMRPGIED